MLSVAHMATITTARPFIHESCTSGHITVDSVSGSGQKARRCPCPVHALNMRLKFTLRAELLLLHSAALTALERGAPRLNRAEVGLILCLLKFQVQNDRHGRRLDDFPRRSLLAFGRGTTAIGASGWRDEARRLEEVRECIICGTRLADRLQRGQTAMAS